MENFFKCSNELDATNLQGRQLIDNKRLSQSYDELNSKFYLTGILSYSFLQTQFKVYEKNSTMFVLSANCVIKLLHPYFYCTKLLFLKFLKAVYL